MDGVSLIRNKINRGKGYSLRKAFNLCIEKKYQFAIKEITPGSNSKVYKYIGFKNFWRLGSC